MREGRTCALFTVLHDAHKFLLIMDIELTVNMTNMSFRSAFRNVKLLLDVRRIIPLRQQEQDFCLAPRQKIATSHSFAAFFEPTPAVPAAQRSLGSQSCLFDLPCLLLCIF